MHEYAGNTSLDWQQSYNYDRWGNRLINNSSNATWGDGINNVVAVIDPITNQMYANGDTSLPMNQRQVQYDPAGNQTKDNLTSNATRTYDAENRMITATDSSNHPSTYSYDGDGHRVKRSVPVAGQPSPVETWQVYGLGGELIAEYAQNGSATNPQKEYGYRNGQLLVTASVTTGWGTAPTLNDNPLSVGQTTVQARHITELRTAINAVRSHVNMSAYSWQYSATTNDYISANPILEMRTALDQALGAPSGGYSEGLAQNQLVMAIHIQELRNRVLAAWQSGSGVDIRWMVSDQLGTPRMIFDQSGSLANVSRHDYLPFGEELGAVTGGRTTALGYTSSDGVRQHFSQKERDNETGLDYFGARYYGSTQGRFTGVDPISRTKYHITDPQRWNGYTYALNNPLVMIDLDGKFAWTFFIRSFIFTSTVAHGWYGGDGRGPSTADSPAATSRVSLRFTLDMDKSQITSHSIFSDPTRLFLPGGLVAYRRGSPDASFGAVETFARNQKVTELHYWGKDPIPGGVTPDLDVHAKLAVTENKDRGLLSISGRVTGDTFPSTEAFVQDQSGKRVFLGAKYEEGGVADLYGDNKQNLFEVNMQIRFDKKGNFTAVIADGKTYSIDAWNKRVQGQF